MEDTIAGNISPTNTQKIFAADYSERFPKVYGQKLGVLLSGEDSNLYSPIHETISDGYFDIYNSPTLINAYFSNSDENISYS